MTKDFDRELDCASYSENHNYNNHSALGNLMQVLCTLLLKNINVNVAPFGAAKEKSAVSGVLFLRNAHVFKVGVYPCVCFYCGRSCHHAHERSEEAS